MRKVACRNVAGMAVVIAVTSASLAAHAAPLASVVPFGDFVAGLAASRGPALTTAPQAAAAQEMRQHLLRQYGGVQVKHSYALGEQVFDCVPIDQQPGVRLQGIKHIAEPPPSAPVTQPSAALGAPLGAG